MSKKSKIDTTEKKLKQAMVKEVCKEHKLETDQAKSSVQKWFNEHVQIMVIK